MRIPVSGAVLAAAVLLAPSAQAQDMWTNGMGFGMFSAVDLSGAYAGASIGTGAGSFVTGEWSGANPWLPTVGVFGGYNMFAGNVMFGGEVELAHGFGTHDLGGSWSERSSRSLPYVLSQGASTGAANFHTVTDGGALEIETHHYNSLQAVAVPTVSARIGYQMDQVLFYGRVGGGIAVLNRIRGTDDSRSTYCNEFLTHTVDDGTDRTTSVVDCLSPYEGESSAEIDTHFAPVLTLGAGAEYHFDQMFVRAEGRMTHYFLGDELTAQTPDAGGLTTWQIGLGAGVRF